MIIRVSLILFVCSISWSHGQTDQKNFSDTPLFKRYCLAHEQEGWCLVNPLTPLTIQDFRENQDVLLRLQPQQQWMLQSSFVDTDGKNHDRYRFFNGGLPVENSTLTIHHQDQQVYFIQFQSMGPLPFAPPIFKTSEKILAKAEATLPQHTFAWESAELTTLDLPESAPLPPDFQEPTPEKIWYWDAEEKKYLTGYKLEMRSLKPDNFYQVILDGKSLELARQLPLTYNCQPSKITAETNYYGQREIATQKKGFIQKKHLLSTCEPQYIQTKYHELNSFGEVRTWSSISDISLRQSDWGSEEQVGASAHWAALEAWQTFAVQFGWLGPDNQQGSLRVLADWRDPKGKYVPNARYLNHQGQSYIYVGGLAENPLVTLDLIGHEYAHGFISHASGLAYSRTSGAIHEGLADIFGTLVEYYVLRDEGTWDWKMGDRVYTFRDLADPHSLQMPKVAGPSDPYWYDNSIAACPEPNNLPFPTGNDRCGIHQNSTVMSHWFYLLAEGGQGLDVPVSPIGIETAGEIIFHTVAAYVQEEMDFEAMRAATLQATADLYGPCSRALAEVRNAWAAVGVGEPHNEFCVNIIGENQICIDSSKVYTYEVIGPPTATYKWSGIPVGWEYYFDDLRKQKLVLLDSDNIFPQTELTVKIEGSNISEFATISVAGVECAGKTGGNTQTLPTFEEIRLYPNPAQAQLRVFFPKHTFPCTLRLIEIQGRVLQTQQVLRPQQVLSLEALRPGMYFLVISGPMEMHRLSFIKD
ncbi:MAG: M4 family metallopeptidase [Bacteroidota bacterium]